MSTSTTTPFAIDSVKSSSHASIDFKYDSKLSISTKDDVSRSSKLCIDFKETDLLHNSARSHHDGFTRITEREEEEIKPARYELGRG